MGDEPQQTYTTGEAAKILGVHPRTVKREIERGNLEAYPVGLREHRIPRDALERYKQRERPKRKVDKGELATVA